MYRTKTVPVEYDIKSDDTGDGWIVEFLASRFKNVDVYGDRVMPGSFKSTLKEKLPNNKIRLFFEHQHVLGRVLDAKETEDGLWVKGRISQTALGQDVKTLLSDGALTDASFGYDVIDGESNEYGGLDLKVIDLWEVSLCGIGANSEATVLALKNLTDEQAAIRAELAQLKSTDRSTMDTKAASGSTDLPLADESTSWDGPAAMKQLAQWASNEDGETDYNKMAQGVFWRAESPESQDDLKLPFAVPDGDGLKAVPAGVKAAANVVMGGMGGVDVPEADMSGIKSKIGAYFKKMGESPPWEDDDSSDDGEGKASAESAEDTDSDTEGGDASRAPEAMREMAKQYRQNADDLDDLADLIEGSGEDTSSAEPEESDGKNRDSDRDSDSFEKQLADFRAGLKPV